MTEDEAKTKWCPQVRFTSDSHKNTVSINKYIDGGIPPASNCIASDCMMWKETHEIRQDPETKEMGAYPNGGHCGLIK